jgi:hypothetical protein
MTFNKTGKQQNTKTAFLQEQNFQEENLDKYLPMGDHHIKHTCRRTDQ